MTSTDATMAETKTSQVRIQLSSRSPDIELPEDTGPILVSTALRRIQLSTLVNRLLETDTPIPFEFLINGQFLRTSLDDFLTANGISAETTLNVEYVRALIPPSHVASFEHDDWVSSVDVLSATAPAVRWLKKEKRDAWVGQERIVSGCYDGLVRVWNTSGSVIATSASAAEGGHSGPVKAAKFLSPTQVVSASIDRTIRLWDFVDEATPSVTGSLNPAVELYGHSAAVDALAVHAPSNRILSGSSDHTVGLWTSSLSGPAAPSNTLPLPSTKRRKLSTPNRQSDAPKRGPLALLQSHTAPVSAVAFKPNDYSVAYSTSWDHSLKTWDLPTQTCVDTRATSHALLSLLPLDSLNLVAAGTSARHITLIDPRAGAERISAMTLRGHQNAVVSLAAVPGSEFGLVSGGHDGGVRVWDVRSVRAGQEGAVGECVFSVEREGKGGKSVGGEGVKVFGVVWDERVGLVSGGEDKKIQVHQEVKR